MPTAILDSAVPPYSLPEENKERFTMDFTKEFTQSEHEAQFAPEEKELLVSYKTKSGIRNWGSFCNRNMFNSEWGWFKQQIVWCEVVDMRKGKAGRTYIWRPETGWFEI